MIKIDYDSNPNIFDVKRVSTLIASTFVSDPSTMAGLINHIEKFLHRFDEMQYNWPTSKQLKKLKSKLFENVGKIARGMAESCNIPEFKSIADIEHDRQRMLNIIVTLARWPEWFLYPESYLRDIADNMDEHLAEINAITFYEDGERICPYNPDIKPSYTNLQNDIKSQEQYIEEFASKHGLPDNLFSIDDLIHELDKIHLEYTSPLYRPDDFERGFVNSIAYIRRNIGKINIIMDRIADGEAISDDFGRSESRSVLSEFDRLIQTLNQLGFKKTSIPAVLANIFHGKYQHIQMKEQEGQIILDVDLQYFDVAPGLGPGMKIRYVFNIHVEIQNLLSSLADLIKEADTKYDIEAESYLDQLGSINNNMHLITDAYCIDAIGYSDYLIRTAYDYILRLYGISDFNRQQIMSILGSPLKIKQLFYEVLFGSMQGCKLLVFIMNHANRLIGILAKRLNKKRDYKDRGRSEAGDDTYAYLMGGIWNEEEIFLEMKVFMCFNCPTNMSKYAWLHKDGYFDYCSKYYTLKDWNNPDNGIMYIGGLPPKLIGKQFLSIKSFSEIFKFTRNCKGVRNSINFIVQANASTLYSEWTIGLDLPNIMGETVDLLTKVKRAKQVSYLLGGLAEHEDKDWLKTAKHARILLEKLLVKYRFQAEGVYLVIHKLGIADTELGKALGSVERLSLAEIMHSIKVLRESEDGVIYDKEEIEKACNLINRLERNIIKGLSISSTSSTYHRVTTTKDIDSFIDDDAEETPLVNSIDNPNNILELSLLINNFAQTEYTQVDNMKHHIRCMIAYNQIRHRISTINRFGYVNYYAEDDDGMLIKLTTENRLDYSSYTSGGKYKHPDLIQNAYLKIFNEYLSGDYKTIGKIVNGFHNVRTELVNEVLSDLCNKTYNRLSDQLIKTIAENGEKEVKKHIQALIEEEQKKYERKLAKQLGKKMYARLGF